MYLQRVDRTLEELGQFNTTERMVKESTMASEQNVLRASCIVHPSVKNFFDRPVLIHNEIENREKNTMWNILTSNVLNFVKDKFSSSANCDQDLIKLSK